MVEETTAKWMKDDADMLIHFFELTAMSVVHVSPTLDKLTIN